MLKGLLVGGITLGIAAIFPETLVLPFFAAILGLSIGVFPGMAMADVDFGRSGVEWAAAISILGLGMVGLWLTPLLLAAAWVLLGVWELLHRFTSLGDEFPERNLSFCLTFDLVVAGFVVYLWAVGG